MRRHRRPAGTRPASPLQRRHADAQPGRRQLHVAAAKKGGKKGGGGNKKGPGSLMNPPKPAEPYLQVTRALKRSAQSLLGGVAPLSADSCQPCPTLLQTPVIMQNLLLVESHFRKTGRWAVTDRALSNAPCRCCGSDEQPAAVAALLLGGWQSRAVSCTLVRLTECWFEAAALSACVQSCGCRR